MSKQERTIYLDPTQSTESAKGLEEVKIFVISVVKDFLKINTLKKTIPTDKFCLLKKMSPNLILKPILIAQIYEHTDGSYNKIQRRGVTWKSYIERIKIKPLKNRLTIH